MTARKHQEKAEEIGLLERYVAFREGRLLGTQAGERPDVRAINAVKWTRLSCHDFADNQVRLQLFALAYNLGNFLRPLALPNAVKHWSLIPTYVGTAGEADQDRCEGAHPRPVRSLPGGGSGGDGEGLCGSPMNASTQGVLGEIMPPKRSNTPCAEQRTGLPISRSVIDSSRRPASVVGQRSPGKSRSKPL